jgi:quercetin dioxygenase-like cupin family protein
MSSENMGPPPMSEVVPGVRVRQMVGQATGAGAVTLGELHIDAGGALPPHRHRVEEAFYVLSGQVRATVRGTALILNAGDSARAPAEFVHGLENVGEDRARVIFAFPAISVEREWADDR